MSKTILSLLVTEISIDAITVKDRRPIDNEQVQIYAKSIERDGMKTPIDVVRAGTGYLLVAGAHRLAACKTLGMKTISARVLSEEQAKGWAHAEDLFRHLKKLDEFIHMVEYIHEHNLTRHPIGLLKGGRQPTDKGYSRAAQATGWSHNRIREAYLHWALPEPIKEKVRLHKLDDNRDFLTRLSRLSSPAAREALILEMKGSRKSYSKKTDKSAVLGLSVAARRARMTLLGDLWFESEVKEVYDQQPVDIQQEFLRSL